jgi:hypothetical protein
VALLRFNGGGHGVHPFRWFQKRLTARGYEVHAGAQHVGRNVLVIRAIW